MLTEYRLSFMKYRDLGLYYITHDDYDKKKWTNSVNGILIELWRIAVRLKYLKKTGLYCQLCGYPYPSDIHHIINKSHGLCVKYLVENGIPLCRSCHAVAETAEIKEKIWSSLPVEEREKIAEANHKICKLTPDFIENTFNDLCKYIDKILVQREKELTTP